LAEFRENFLKTCRASSLNNYEEMFIDLYYSSLSTVRMDFYWKLIYQIYSYTGNTNTLTTTNESEQSVPNSKIKITSPITSKNSNKKRTRNANKLINERTIIIRKIWKNVFWAVLSTKSLSSQNAKKKTWQQMPWGTDVHIVNVGILQKWKQHFL